MKVHLCTPPHKLTKMWFFMQLGIMKHRVSVSEKWPHFQKWQKHIHFISIAIYKNSKKQFCVCRNFSQLCPVKFTNFKVYPKKYYDLWKVRFLRIIGKHRGSNQLCPVKIFLPCAALYFALFCPVRFLLNHSKTSGVSEVCIFWCKSFIEFYRGFVNMPCKKWFCPVTVCGHILSE